MRQNHRLWACATVLIAVITGCAEPQLGIKGSATENRLYVAVDRLNLRDCAGTECRIVEVLTRGDSGTVMGGEAGWIKLKIDGKQSSGWVAERYLSATPIAKRPAKKRPAEKPKIPEEGFATPGDVPPAVTEELATPEQKNGAKPKITIKEELAE